MFSRKLIGALAVLAAASAVPVASATENPPLVPECIGQPATIVGTARLRRHPRHAG